VSLGPGIPFDSVRRSGHGGTEPLLLWTQRPDRAVGGAGSNCATSHQGRWATRNGSSTQAARRSTGCCPGFLVPGGREAHRQHALLTRPWALLAGKLAEIGRDCPDEGPVLLAADSSTRDARQKVAAVMCQANPGKRPRAFSSVVSPGVFFAVDEWEVVAPCNLIAIRRAFRRAGAQRKRRSRRGSLKVAFSVPAPTIQYQIFVNPKKSFKNKSGRRIVPSLLGAEPGQVLMLDADDAD